MSAMIRQYMGLDIEMSLGGVSIGITNDDMANSLSNVLHGYAMTISELKEKEAEKEAEKEREKAERQAIIDEAKKQLIAEGWVEGPQPS